MTVVKVASLRPGYPPLALTLVAQIARLDNAEQFGRGTHEIITWRRYFFFSVKKRTRKFVALIDFNGNLLIGHTAQFPPPSANPRNFSTR